MIDENDESLDEGSIVPEESKPELSLRESLAAAMAEDKAKARGEDGKFAKKDEEPAKKDVKNNADSTQEIKAAVKAPDAWDATFKEKFAQLPPEMQQYLSKREADIHKGFTKQDEDRNFGKQMRDVVTPYLPMIRAEGGEPTQAVQNILQSIYQLKQSSPQQRAEMFLGMAREYGADFQHMFATLQKPQAQVDPRYQQLEQKLSRLEQERLQEQQAREFQTTSQAQTEIERFASDPANANFEAVKSDMAILLQAGKAKGLQEAYEMACYMNPQIRPLMIQTTTQSKMSQIADKANKAKQAGASVSGAPSASSKPAPIDKSTRELLKDAFRAARN